MCTEEIKFANLRVPIIFAINHTKIQSFINLIFYGFFVQ